MEHHWKKKNNLATWDLEINCVGSHVGTQNILLYILGKHDGLKHCMSVDWDRRRRFESPRGQMFFFSMMFRDKILLYCLYIKLIYKLQYSSIDYIKRHIRDRVLYLSMSFEIYINTAQAKLKPPHRLSPEEIYTRIDRQTRFWNSLMENLGNPKYLDSTLNNQRRPVSNAHLLLPGIYAHSRKIVEIKYHWY